MADITNDALRGVLSEEQPEKGALLRGVFWTGLCALTAAAAYGTMLYTHKKHVCVAVNPQKSKSNPVKHTKPVMPKKKPTKTQVKQYPPEQQNQKRPDSIDTNVIKWLSHYRKSTYPAAEVYNKHRKQLVKDLPNPKTSLQNVIHDSEVTLFARNIYAEMRAEGWEAKYAVGDSVFARIAQRKRCKSVFKGVPHHSLKAVILSPSQYSWLNCLHTGKKPPKNTRFSLDPYAQSIIDQQAWIKSYLVAHDLIRQYKHGRKGHQCTHYHTRTTDPTWAKGKTPFKVIKLKHSPDMKLYRGIK